MNKFMETNKKIEKAVVTGYKAIEDGVVEGYKKIENKFVESFLTPDAPVQPATNKIRVNTKGSEGNE